MKELSFDELLREYRPHAEPGVLAEDRRLILEAVALNHGHGVILFRNEAFDSSAFGESTLLVWGPDCTYATPAAVEGQHLGDLPSQRQYPVAWATVRPRCQVCGGSIFRHAISGTPSGPWLHADDTDWTDNTHQAVPGA